jgi:Transglycosylase SLT domain
LALHPCTRVAAFASQGVKSVRENALPQGEATLFLPSGSSGPAFLLSANYWILKAYNNSDSYALSLALLAERIEGKSELRDRWPEGEVFLSRTLKGGATTVFWKSLDSTMTPSTAVSGRPRATQSMISRRAPALLRPTATPNLLRRAAEEADRQPSR